MHCIGASLGQRRLDLIVFPSARYMDGSTNTKKCCRLYHWHRGKVVEEVVLDVPEPIPQGQVRNVWLHPETSHQAVWSKFSTSESLPNLPRRLVGTQNVDALMSGGRNVVGAHPNLQAPCGQASLGRTVPEVLASF